MLSQARSLFRLIQFLQEHSVGEIFLRHLDRMVVIMQIKSHQKRGNLAYEWLPDKTLFKGNKLITFR